MPRKPKKEPVKVTVVVDGKPVVLTLRPPSGVRKSWYVYWNGLTTSKATGCKNFDEAVTIAEGMLRNSGRRSTVSDALLSDEEFIEVQKAHFCRRTDPGAKARASKTLDDVLYAVSAFKKITGLAQIATATPGDCARFQREALVQDRNWRSAAGKIPCAEMAVDRISPNTVLKWSRSLQAAFERINKSAGKKCVRGVVDEGKLLSSNPWTQFTWIEGRAKPIRQFDGDELISLLDHLEQHWSSVPVAAAAIKVFLWSSCRKSEVASLIWSSERIVGPKNDPSEVHFEVVGKWGIERWFRLPVAVYRELLNFRTNSDFVFAAYSQQIRAAHSENLGCQHKIRDDYDPQNFGRWLYGRVKEWSRSCQVETAYLHHFRKTMLQHARRGEDINRQVASDVRVGESVMMTSYVKETDGELRAKSNRTFLRIVASLSEEVANRYGPLDSQGDVLETQLWAAMAAKDWRKVAELSAELEDKHSNRIA